MLTVLSIPGSEGLEVMVYKRQTLSPRDTARESSKLQLILQAPLDKRLANKKWSTNLAGVSSPNHQEEVTATVTQWAQELTFGDSHGHLCIFPCSILIVNGQYSNHGLRKAWLPEAKS